jgi:hypothetical protein
MLRIAESGVEMLAELEMHKSSDSKNTVEWELKAKKGAFVTPELSCVLVVRSMKPCRMRVKHSLAL